MGKGRSAPGYLRSADTSAPRPLHDLLVEAVQLAVKRRGPDSADWLRIFNRHVDYGPVSGPGGVYEEYRYDALGRRVLVRSRCTATTSGDPVTFADPFGLCKWHEMSCWNDRILAAGAGGGSVRRFATAAASLALELTGAVALDEQSRAAAGGSVAAAPFVRHTILDRGGQVVDDHFRTMLKPPVDK